VVSPGTQATRWMKRDRGRGSTWLASSWRGTIVSFGLALICGCTPTSDQVGAENVKGGIQQLRKLSFVTDVPFVAKSGDEARQMMVAKLNRDSSEEELRVGGQVGIMTGLFPSGTDLKSKQIELMNQEIAGFYDPHDKVMIQVRGKSAIGQALTGRPQVTDELLEAHELTHALQDQHFDLEAMLLKVKDNDDEEIALHSVIEGDATLAGLAYVSGGLTEDLEKKIVDHFSSMPESFQPESAGTPLALSAPMMFQYVQGTRFVAEAWQRGGWAAVDAIYRDPPRSTQEIMNPALYFDQRPPVTKVTLDGYSTLMSGWKKVDDDTFGELLLKLILQRNLPAKSPALSLPAQWRADRMIALQKDNALAVIWMIAFHDRASAEDFAAAYAPILEKLKSSSSTYRLTTEGNAVLVLIGPESLPLTELATTVWKSSKIALEPSGNSNPTPGKRAAGFDSAALASHS